MVADIEESSTTEAFRTRLILASGFLIGDVPDDDAVFDGSRPASTAWCCAELAQQSAP